MTGKKVAKSKKAAAPRDASAKKRTDKKTRVSVSPPNALAA